MKRLFASSLRVIGAVTMLLVLGGVWLARSQTGHELARQLLEARTGLSIGALDADWRGARDVSGYTARGKRLHAEKLRFDGSWWGLYERRLDEVTLTLADGEAHGWIDFDGHFGGRLRVAAGELSLHGRILGGRVDLEAKADELGGARWRAGGVRLHLEVADDGGRLTLTAGELRAGGRKLARVEAAAHGTLQRVTVDRATAMWAGELWHTVGPVDVRLDEKTAQGTIGHGGERLRVDADWSLGLRARVSGELLASRVSSLPGRAQVRLRYDSRRGRQPIAVRWAGGPFELEARTRVSSHGLVPDEPLDGTVRLREATAGELRQVSGSLRLHGTVAAPLLDGDLRATADTPLGELPIDARVSLGRDARAELTVETPSLKATAEARAPLDLLHLSRDWRELPLAIDGRVRGDAKLLRALPLDGALAGTFAVRGNLSHPKATARLHGERLRLWSEPLSVELTVHDGVADIERLELAHEGATLRAHGRAQLDGSALEAQLSAAHLPLHRGRVAAWLDGELALRLRRGNDGRYGGEVTLLSGQAQVGRVAVDRDLQEVGPLADVVFVDKRPAAADSAFLMTLARVGDKTALTARIDGPFLVKGSDVEVALKGSLRVDGGKVKGTIDALPGGWIELYGRRYSVDRVRLSLDDSRVEVRLTRPAPQGVMHIDLHGSLDAPRVSLTSDPPIYDAAQLAALVMNGDVGARRDEKALAGALTNAILGRLKSELLPQLPLDVFKLDGDRVEAGKLFGERLYLAWVHNQVTADMVRHVNRDQGQIEVRLPRGWLLETMYGDQGVGSVDLSWTRRF